ncbi:hypothetical protein NLI96_g13271 [Meripilus lineatus]|uniref:Uncharacterized protein n=1 Tax=Meripilus lineatus TaxID=2056292 RepID=A0AAD5YBM9_9APHY|nr:hypothetical protein NLI96_g13271 [Physisporinus lineatus]
MARFEKPLADRSINFSDRGDLFHVRTTVSEAIAKVTAAYDISLDGADVIDLGVFMGNKFGGGNAMNATVQYPISLLKFDPKAFLNNVINDPQFGSDYAWKIASRRLGEATTTVDKLYQSHQEDMVQAAVEYVGQHLDAYEKVDASRYDISGFRLGAPAADLLQRSEEAQIQKDAAIGKLAKEGSYHGSGFLPIHTGAPTASVDASGNMTATSKGVDIRYTCKTQGSKLGGLKNQVQRLAKPLISSSLAIASSGVSQPRV